MILLSEAAACVIISTFNNAKTLKRVLDGVLQYSSGGDILVVNDGSTDGTAEILKSYGERIVVLKHFPNKGKGFSLRKGFKKALDLGFKNAVTIDSDGQHFPSDIPSMISATAANPGSMIMGSRNMAQETVPGKSSFGNKFSNFWFWFETGIRLPDTQTGFRVYPLEKVNRLNLLTNKFELEIEVIVKLAWKHTPFVPVPVKVTYDPAERVTHFRPFQDFSRISLLNTVFVIMAIAWFIPLRAIKKLFSKKFWEAVKHEAIKPEEPAFVKAMSIGFGAFMGIVPIWGFQLLVGIPLAILFKMNKVLFISAAHISIPPMIPLVVYSSYKMGEPFFLDKVIFESVSEISFEAIHLHFLQYVTGAVFLAIVAGFATFLIAWLVLGLFGKKNSTDMRPLRGR